jgi:UDP-GlcNAc:undecaprenyl-phosphate GlcNAc-1-phosphate transferase
VASAISPEAEELFAPKSGRFLGFLGACSLVFLTGLFDDWRVASWQQKLVGQVGAGVAVYAAGYRIEELAFPWGSAIDLGWLAPLATIAWVVFFTNAINLVDGKDGVAVGVSILAAATLAQVASHSEHPTVALLLVAMAGGGLGFLPFNLPPASSILGDSGALLMGFVLGSLSIRGATGVSDAVFISVPIVALGFPILDTVLAAGRRALDRSHPFRGDSDHIHHRLEVLGLGPRGILAVLYGLSVLFSGAAIVLHYVDYFPMEMAVFGALVALVAVVLTRLGYAVSLWNSHSVVWLRRKTSILEAEVPAETPKAGD